ncbi:MAG: glyoxalase [Spirulinaceae cyanobacterium SM2_1_0]|nr:glyoxalase [Spirulinaceae cyanobacterium SM2_1_0]
MAMTHYLHTALLVTDLARATEFYGEILGLPPVERPLSYAGAWYQLGEQQLHLIAAVDYQATLHNPAQWGRNPHLALGTLDLAAVKAKLLASGYELQMSSSGRAALFTRDPDGNVIEISQV